MLDGQEGFLKGAKFCTDWATKLYATQLPKALEKVNLVKPFYKTNIGNTFLLDAFETYHNIQFIWEVPRLVELNLHKPHIVFNHLVEQDGLNSLKYHLKNNGLISNISVNNSDEGVIILDIDLTILGYKNINIFINNNSRNFPKMNSSALFNISIKPMETDSQNCWIVQENKIAFVFYYNP
jgi:secreted Zn-dependent insulinase-like peptidase